MTKNLFGVILNNENSLIGFEKLFGLITPTPKFWSWRSQFYRIGSWLVCFVS
jgi:hypothetical protein